MAFALLFFKMDKLAKVIPTSSANCVAEIFRCAMTTSKFTIIGTVAPPYKKKGIMNRPVRAMVVGIPNVGKSTFINAYAGRACAKTGNKPGVTKGKQWIKLSKTVELLDTPGILWPKFDSELVGRNLALIGSMNDEVINIEDLAFEAVTFLKNNYSGNLSERYGIDEDEETLEIMDAIAAKRGCLKRGAMTDYEKLAGIILDDFRSGRIGRITLEKPGEEI